MIEQKLAARIRKILEGHTKAVALAALLRVIKGIALPGGLRKGRKRK